MAAGASSLVENTSCCHVRSSRAPGKPEPEAGTRPGQAGDACGGSASLRDCFDRSDKLASLRHRPGVGQRLLKPRWQMADGERPPLLPRLSSSVICHLPFVICHLPSAICHLSFAICHLPSAHSPPHHLPVRPGASGPRGQALESRWRRPYDESSHPGHPPRFVSRRLGTGSGIEEIRCLQLGQAGPHRGLVGKRMAGGLSWAARLQAQDGPGEPEVLLRRELEIER